jgi:DNA-binding HxlR family transcriptional regulator
MQPGYKQFCPLAMAAELLCTRWTMVLLRELVAGNDALQRSASWGTEDVPDPFISKA